ALSAAGQNAAAQIGAVYDGRAKLSPYGAALLGLPMERAKDARTPLLAKALESSVRQDAEEAWWPSVRDPLLDFSEDATAEATAFAVRFLSHQDANSPLLPKA